MLCVGVVVVVIVVAGVVVIIVVVVVIISVLLLVSVFVHSSFAVKRKYVVNPERTIQKQINNHTRSRSMFF